MSTRQIISMQDARIWGKLLHNRNTLKLLRELAAGPLTKSKIAQILGVNHSTVNGYIRDLTDLGAVYDVPVLKEGRYVHLIHSRLDGLEINFKELDENK